MPEDIFEEDKKDDEEELEKDGSEVIEEIADEIGDEVEDIVEEVLGGGGGDEDADTEKSEDEEDEDLDKCKKSEDEDEEEVEKEDEEDEDDLEKSDDEEDEDIEKEDEDEEEEPDVEKRWTVPLFKSEDQQIVCGVVSEPGSVDLQGDVLTESEIRKACHSFMMRSRRIGYEHNGPADVDIVESYIAPVNYECGGQIVKKGSWVMAAKIHDPDLWHGVKKGEINGFSIAGTGTRTPLRT